MSDGRSRAWLWVLIGSASFLIFFLAIFGLLYASLRTQRGDMASAFGEKIGVVDLEGVIIEPKDVVDDLRDFADDDSIKAIVLHVNTPGGGAAASEEIYREVLRIRDGDRSEEHTSELQSRLHLACRLLLEKNKHRRDLRGRQPPLPLAAGRGPVAADP